MMKTNRIEQLTITLLILFALYEIFIGIKFFSGSMRFIYITSFSGISLLGVYTLYKKPKEVKNPRQLVMFLFIVFTILKLIVYGNQTEWIMDYILSGMIAVAAIISAIVSRSTINHNN